MFATSISKQKQKTAKYSVDLRSVCTVQLFGSEPGDQIRAKVEGCVNNISLFRWWNLFSKCDEVQKQVVYLLRLLYIIG